MEKLLLATRRNAFLQNDKSIFSLYLRQALVAVAGL